MSTEYRFFKLINNEVVFGETEVVQGPHGPEMLIKTPYTAKSGNIMPYMVDIMTEAPAAVQIHVMNILWTVPLDEFPEAYKVYTEATSRIITNPQQKIII